jgi:hypothetical protein
MKSAGSHFVFCPGLNYADDSQERLPFKKRSLSSVGDGGAEGDRTPDLMNAIHALSQLSYGPVPWFRPTVADVSACNDRGEFGVIQSRAR